MDNLWLLGILAVMMAPMVFGAITFLYSHKYTEQVTKEWWDKMKQNDNEQV